MSTDLTGMLSLRHKLQQLIFEPTLDKVFSVFTSTMLGTSIIAFFSTYTDPRNIQLIYTKLSFEVFIAVNMTILISFLLAVLSALTALYYKRKHEPVLKQQDERLKSNKEWNYLFDHKHLTKASITLDKLDEWRKEMNWLRTAVVSLIKYTVEKNSLTAEEIKNIENPEALPTLDNIPSFPDLSDDIVSTDSPSSTSKTESKKSIAQELDDLETLEL